MEHELQKLRQQHEGEARRLRALADEYVRNAAQLDQKIQAYDVVLNDLRAIAEDSAEAPPSDHGQAEIFVPEEDADEPTDEPANGDAKDSVSFGVLIRMVREAAAEQQGEFTNNEIRVAVEAKAAPGFLATMEPKAITKTLWQLAKAGEIELIRSGHGQRPAVYANRIKVFRRDL